MTSLDAILAAVQRIHSAPITANGWTGALSFAAAAARSENTFLVSGRPSADVAVIGIGTEPENLKRFAAVAREGRLPRWMNRAPILVPQPSSAIMPDREFARSDFYNEVPRPMGGFYGVVTPFQRSSHLQAFFVAGRKLGREDYDKEDISVIRILSQHLTAALHVAERIADAEMVISGVCSALDRPNAGVILVDAAGKIFFANRRADEALTACDGLQCEGNVLAASNQRASGALRRRIAACAESAHVARNWGGSLEVPRKQGRGLLRLYVAPLRFDDIHRDIDPLAKAYPKVIVIAFDPEDEVQTTRDNVRHKFGLTRAEAAVAMEILNGDGREAAALRLGIAPATVRTHLTHIFEKVGVHRQAELVRLLLESVKVRFER